MVEKEPSFLEKIKAKEEKAKIADQINKKNEEISTLLVIFYITWIAAGVYLIDYMHSSNARVIFLLVWSFSFLLPLTWK